VFFAPLVPALAVVVVGYLVGYGVTVLVSRGLDAAFGAPLGAGVPEVVGWLLGLALLVGVVRWLLLRRRRRAHQK
jgi:predicted ABC-type sugar transport system permease subunit